jgi:pimeloyl-ACP methyl ester carboxylesterase
VAAAFAASSQQALDRVLADCDADEQCREAFPRLRDELEATAKRLGGHGEVAKIRDPFSGREVEMTVTAQIFASLVHYSLYTDAGAARLPARIHAAHEGDLAPLVEHTARFAAMTAPQFSDGALFSAVCSEDVPFYDLEQIAQDARGTLLGDAYPRGLEKACERWPTPPVPADFKEPVESDVPTLLISGAADPVTPPEVAEDAARTLSESLHVVLPEGGHSSLGGECVGNLMTRFIEAGTTRDLDTSCAARVRRPAFRTSP